MGSNVIGIGYEGLDIDGLLSWLRIRGVSTVVDVRLNPISRKRGFSKNGLSERLRATGISYEHLPELGNPRENRDAFADRDGADGAAARDRFSQILLEPAATAGLNRVVEFSEGGTVALLCFERDEAACHRELILEAVRDRQPVAI